jgi:DNA polymerase III epsilon subunit-like protein
MFQLAKLICLDLETLSTETNAVIVTIAAVKFSLTNDEVETFNVNVNPREGIELGLHVSQSTVEWWKTKPKEVINAWKHSQTGLSAALDMFDEFVSEKDLGFMSNGMAFDFPILDSSYRVLGRKTPYNYWQTYDMRTIFWAAGFNTKSAPRVGNYHVGIDDCLTQISWLRQCMNQS